MRFSRALAVPTLLCCSTFFGCGSTDADLPVAPSEDELIQYLKDNPEIANEVEAEDEAEDE